MITDIHKRAVRMWVYSKLSNSEIDPSVLIISQVTGKIPKMITRPSNTVELCQLNNELNGLSDLTEAEKVEIQKYGIQLVNSNDGSRSIMLAKAQWLKWLNRIGYILGIISIGIGGFTWWILGFGILTWWAFGAAKMASHKQNYEPEQAWEMPAHVIIHVLALGGLWGFSIFNIIK
jgi:hypothetical protein